MAKYKKCPSCGSYNSPTSFECTECGYDLTSVAIFDPQTEEDSNAKVSVSQENESSHVTYVKVCECGAVNPPNARTCSKCGSDISFLIPQLADDVNSSNYSLRIMGTDYVYDLVEPETVIGREFEMKEYLSARAYVSRRHAEFMISDGKCYVRDLNSTNHTFVNGVRTEGMVEIHPGDVVSLGGIVSSPIDGNICVLTVEEKA